MNINWVPVMCSKASYEAHDDGDDDGDGDGDDYIIYYIKYFSVTK